jgi:uncharacterized protein YukE
VDPAAIYQQLGVAGVVVIAMATALRWVAVMLKESNARTQALHDLCEKRQAEHRQFFDEAIVHQFDKSNYAMQAMARALDNVASAINDTRTPVRPLPRIHTEHDIVPPPG